jgi:hypothetical protein
MEQTLRELIVANGFKAVYEQLDTLRDEYRQFYEAQIEFMNGFILPTLIAVAPTPPSTPALVPEVKQIAISEQVLDQAEASNEGKEIVIEQVVQEKKKMKVIRKGNKTIHVPERLKVAELVAEQLAEQPTTESGVEQAENTFTEVKPQPKRSSAEMKKWQREQEAVRRTYMKENKISRSSLMTEENVRKWIEEEGNSYAWVAREQLGCKEEDVSTFAKKHKIVRKR